MDEQGRSLKREVNVELRFYPPYLRVVDGDVRGVLFETRTVEACRKNALHMIVVPMTLLIIVLIIYLNTRSAIKTAIVLLAVPFSLVGAFWLLYLAGYNLSVAVWVGIIALAGLDAETGVVMLLYLDLAYEQWRREGKLRSVPDLRDAIYDGAVKRVRPKAMTAAVIIGGLLPILWSHGAGADVMKRIATPMVGGIVTSTIMELLVVPAIYFIWRSRRLRDSAPDHLNAVAPAALPTVT